MKCGICTDYFDESTQTVVCPHGLLNRAPLPNGGPRIPQDQRALIEEAFRMRDEMALLRLTGHNNVAVRAYAIAMTKTLEDTQGAIGYNLAPGIEPQETKDQ